MESLTKQCTEMEKEYRSAPGLNSTFLAQFYESQDHALLKTPHKSHFETGHIFEDMVRDACKGTTFFKDRYFVSSVTSGGIPDELMPWIEKGVDLETKYVYTTKNERHRTYKTRHAYLDECLNNPGKYPISLYDYDMLSIMLCNFLDMELFGATMLDVLSQAEFQVPIYWEERGIKKKALADAVLCLGATYMFDIKTSANPVQLRQMMNNKYWIQKEHYTEGGKAEYGNIEEFVFLVAYKEDPFLCEPIEICGDTSFEYNDLCARAMTWLGDGKPNKGYLPLRKHYVRLF